MGRETLLPSVFRKLGTSEYVCQVDWEMEVIRVLVINGKGFMMRVLMIRVLVIRVLRIACVAKLVKGEKVIRGKVIF